MEKKKLLDDTSCVMFNFNVIEKVLTPPSRRHLLINNLPGNGSGRFFFKLQKFHFAEMKSAATIQFVAHIECRDDFQFKRMFCRRKFLR